jgi:hypothetical protein
MRSFLKTYYDHPRSNRRFGGQRCDCGKPATQWIYFTQFDSRGQPLQQDLPLCDDCTALALADGCRITPLTA